MTAGMPGCNVSMLTGQKNLASKLNYMSPDDPTLKATNKVLQNIISGEKNAGQTFQDIYQEEKSLEIAEIHQKDEKTPTVPKVETKDKRKPETSSSSSLASSSSGSSDDKSSKQNKKYKRKLKKLKRKIKADKENISPAEAESSKSVMATTCFTPSPAMNQAPAINPYMTPYPMPYFPPPVPPYPFMPFSPMPMMPQTPYSTMQMPPNQFPMMPMMPTNPAFCQIYGQSTMVKTTNKNRDKSPE